MTYDNTAKQKELEKIKQINSDPDELEVLGVVNIDISQNRHALILNLADIHYGGQGFDRDKFIKVLEWGKQIGCYTTILGDSLDLSTSESTTNVQTYQTNNEKSVKGLASDLEIIAPYIVAVLPGNHTAKQGNRIRTLGVCQERPIAEKLNVPYFPYHAMLDLKTKKGNFYIGLTHGDIGKDFQSSADRLIAVAKSQTGKILDAVFMGHFHNYCSYDKVYEYTEYDENLKTYVKKYKTITVEEMPSFTGATEHSVSHGWNPKTNARAFDIILDETGELNNVISFDILDNQGNLSKTAMLYLENLKILDKQELKEKYKAKYSKALEDAKTFGKIDNIIDKMGKEV